MTSGRTAEHQVRPRWVWGGLAAALTGAGILGLGVVLLSGPLSLAGALVLVLGVAGSLHGGVLYDAVPGLSLRRELAQVRAGDVHPGVAAGDMVRIADARRDARRSNERTRALEAAARHRPGVDWAPAAGWGCLLITVVLTVSQWNLVAHDATGADNSVRDTGWAILLGLAGVRVAATTGRHRVAAGVILVAGLGLALGGLLAEHHRTGLALVEVGCGCIAILCAFAAHRSAGRWGQAESSS